MTQRKPPIDASKVTKPIQLLAAWLVGLIAVNGSFLGAAALLERPTWAPGILVISAIANVPIFLFCLFLLQTKFRPEMQEDSYYSKHLERKFSQQTQKLEYVEKTLATIQSSSQIQVIEHIKPRLPRLKYSDVSINDLLPNYRDIIEKLAEVGYRPTDTFGSTSKEPVPPKNFVISIGYQTPVPVAQKIIETIRPFGLQGIGIGEYFSPTSVYIGAFSYDSGSNYVPIDSEDAERLLDETISSSEFFSIIRRYDRGEDPSLFDESDDDS